MILDIRSDPLYQVTPFIYDLLVEYNRMENIPDTNSYMISDHYKHSVAKAILEYYKK
jgi:hypothetical protein